MKTKKPTTTGKSKEIVPKNKDLVAKAAAKSSSASQTFSVMAKSSVFSKCKKSNLQRVLEEYV
jgi:hypothetical protein